MVYVWLAIAVVFEVGWAIAMKLSNGFTRPGPIGATVVMYLLSVVFLSFAARRLEVGVAYAVWAGAGVTLIALAGVLYFDEPITWLKVTSIALIVAGTVVVQIAVGGH